MRVEDQDETMAFLADPASHGLQDEVERIDTHISAIFLAGDRVYKLKRAVKLPYADFSTPAIRLESCEKELALNGTTAPDLYLRVRRITREGQGLAFDGTGALVDAVVEMRRFEQEALLDRMAQRDALTPAMMRDLAAEIAAAHEAARIAPAAEGAANIAGVLDINLAGFHEGHAFSEAEIAALDDAFRRELDRLAPLLDDRARRGWVRRCHGDLHLRNVCMLQGRPQLFDCIEFNDALATIDVLYDLAFMVMDLWHRGFAALANLVANRYLDITRQEEGMPLLPFFTALRAAVRAHVSGTQAEDGTAEERAALRMMARAYYDLAIEILGPRPPRLVGIGGLSGTGKSTMAAALAPELGAPPGARLVESDLARKTMFGVPPETRLPDRAYAPEVSSAVYDTIATRSAALLEAGCSVVADGVYDRPERRADLAAVARAAGAPFDGIWLEADPQVLRARVETRRGAASDATTDVLQAQLSLETGPMDWARVPAAGTRDETLAALRAQLGLDTNKDDGADDGPR